MVTMAYFNGFTKNDSEGQKVLLRFLSHDSFTHCQIGKRDVEISTVRNLSFVSQVHESTEN